MDDLYSFNDEANDAYARGPEQDPEGEMHTFEDQSPPEPGVTDTTDSTHTANGVPFDQFPQARASQPTDAYVATGQTDEGVPNSQFPAPRGGSFNTPAPSEIAAANGAPGFSVDGTTPNGATPSLPNPGTGAPAPAAGGGGAGAGTLTSDQWKQAFEDKYGFYDSRFNSRDNMLANAQRGDTQIKGQLDYMAGLDADARRVDSRIAGTPDFYRSQNAFDWGSQHNQEIQNRIASGEFAQRAGGGDPGAFNGRMGAPPAGGGGLTQNLADLQNLQRQQWTAPAGGPIDNYHALMTENMRTSLEDSLKSLGASNVHTTFDGSGNAVISYSNRSQQPEVIKATLVDMANAIEQLKQRAAAANVPAPPTGNGGGGYAPPRGGNGGGGYAPPRGGYAPPQQAGGGNPYDTSVTPPSGIPGAAFGTNAGGETVGGPYTNRMGPLVDEFGNPFGAGYNPDVTRQTAGGTRRPY